MIELVGKTVLVTGSSRGIGRSILETCHKAGASVILHYHNSEAVAEAIAETLGRERCFVVRGNIANLDEAASFWRQAVEWRGRIDALVNNASIRVDVDPNASDQDADAVWRAHVETNLIGPANLCRLATRHFKTVGGGSIVNIASRAAFRGDTLECLHDGASKAGLLALTKGLARHLGRHNIKCFAVAPGMIETDQLTDFFKIQSREDALREVALGRTGQPHEIAATVAFLLSGLADYATGATIDVNGASYLR
nr:SDR family oxidoreductase [Mesorhizobium sp. WSM4875]